MIHHLVMKRLFLDENKRKKRDEKDKDATRVNIDTTTDVIETYEMKVKEITTNANRKAKDTNANRKAKAHGEKDERWIDHFNSKTDLFCIIEF